MRTKALTESFREFTEIYSESISAVDYEFKENRKQAVVRITTNLSAVEFVYVKKECLYAPISTVFVRVYPIKTIDFDFHLYEIMDKDDLRCTYITNIESKNRMKYCIDYLTSILNQYLVKIEDMVIETDEFSQLMEDKKEQMLKFCKADREEIRFDNSEDEKMYWIQMLDIYESFYQLSRFTRNDAYNSFLCGDYSKSLKKYEKLKDKSEYEQRLCKFMRGDEDSKYPILPEGLFSTVADNKSTFENKYLLKSLPIFMPVFMLFFGALSLIVSIVYSSGTVISPSYWICVICVVAGCLSGLFAAIVFRRKFVEFTERDSKQKEYFVDKDKLYNGKASDVLLRIVLCIILIISTYFSIVFPLSETLVYEDKIVYDDASSFPFTNPKEYYYQDIKEVYYIEGRYNDYGNYIDRSSYIFCYKDGDYIDFDTAFGLSQEQIEKYVLPLSGYHKEDVVILKSDKDFEKLYCPQNNTEATA